VHCADNGFEQIDGCRIRDYDFAGLGADNPRDAVTQCGGGV
jgi:hypothetical protein